MLANQTDNQVCAHEASGTCVGDAVGRRKIRMATLDELLNAAQTLTTGDRLRLMDALWESIPPEEWPVPSQEWVAEAQRRSAAYEAGETSASGWPTVRARARRRAGLSD
jgi:putative addiction module component (TIGR02574 family)